MPGGDRTGPLGLGPRTGRAAGWCSGFPGPGRANPTPGWGAGSGRSFGRGWGRGFRGGFGGWEAPGWGWASPYPPYGFAAAPPETAAEEIEELKDQARQLERALEGIRRRIEELEAPARGGEDG